MMPTDRLTMRSTAFDSKAKEKIAAAEILTTPATVVANRMESSVELMMDPGSHVQQRGKLKHSVTL